MMTRNPDPEFADLLGLVPDPGQPVDWPVLWSLWPEMAALDTCPQSPVHHAEGDVGTHTRMVVEALIADREWQALPVGPRGLLFWTAVLHDIGKPAMTRVEESALTSRGHSRRGAAMARQMLWQAGAPFEWREALCGLIMSHQVPFWLIERPDPQRMAITLSLSCRPDWLCLHARADATGRICEDQQGLLDNVALAHVLFQENACGTGPFAFANATARIAYLNRPDRDPHYTPPEHHRCTAYMMSGLPGAGKDTWITRTVPDLPMISLDQVRAEMGVAASANQGGVAQAALEQARTYLRAGQDFVWNATNVTVQQRARLLRVFHDYEARTHIVYVEPRLPDLIQQNRNRADTVPDKVLTSLIRKLEPPDLREAHRITHVVPSTDLSGFPLAGDVP